MPGALAMTQSASMVQAFTQLPTQVDDAGQSEASLQRRVQYPFGNMGAGGAQYSTPAASASYFGGAGTTREPGLVATPTAICPAGPTSGMGKPGTTAWAEARPAVAGCHPSSGRHGSPISLPLRCAVPASFTVGLPTASGDAPVDAAWQPPLAPAKAASSANVMA